MTSIFSGTLAVSRQDVDTQQLCMQLGDDDMEEVRMVGVPHLYVNEI